MDWRLKRCEGGDWQCLCRCFELNVLGSRHNLARLRGLFNGSLEVDWLALTRIRKARNTHGTGQLSRVDVGRGSITKT